MTSEYPAHESALPPTEPSSEQRRAAVKRLEAKRAWRAGLVTYVVVNGFLIGVWAMSGRGYFWPAWVIGGWGIGVVLSGWHLYGRRPITEDQIRSEMRRG
jgi:sirohydrochlorin ferrochelatase